MSSATPWPRPSDPPLPLPVSPARSPPSPRLPPQLGCSLAICIITDQQFWTYIYGYINWYTTVVYEDTCYLGEVGSTNLCYFNWGMGACLSFLFLVAFFMAMCNCRPGRATPFLIMWAICLILAVALAGVNQSGIPEANTLAQENTATTTDDLVGWRNAILGLSWGLFGLTLLATLAAIMDIKNNKNPPPQAQFYAAGAPPEAYGGGPPPAGYGAPPPGAYGAPPPGAYPPTGAPPPTFYPAPGVAATPGAYVPPPPGAYAPAPGAPAGYPPQV